MTDIDLSLTPVSSMSREQCQQRARELDAKHARLRGSEVDGGLSLELTRKWQAIAAEQRAITDRMVKLDLATIRGAFDGTASDVVVHRGDRSRTDAADAPTRSSGVDAVRGQALDALSRAERTDPHVPRAALEAIARAVESRDEGSDMARYVTVAADPAYRSAFQKVMGNPTLGMHEWDADERQAFTRAQQLQRSMSLTDANGGLMVPFTLDPSVMLSSPGTSNENLRNAFTVRTTTTNSWNGVTSAGVTANWTAEAAQVSDDSPTLGEVNIPVHKGTAFIPFSFEVGQDAQNFSAEMATLLGDAKLRLEAQAFILGSGSGQPTGLITAAVAASKTVASATADTFAEADLYALKAALPARWRSGAGWLANENLYDLVRQFSGGGDNSSFWTDLGGDTPPRLLGKPAWESSEVDGTVGAAATNYVLAYGWLKSFYVIDRVGSTIELVPHLMGAAGRPNGQRGFLLHWRTGSDLTVPDAVRVLNA